MSDSYSFPYLKHPGMSRSELKLCVSMCKAMEEWEDKRVQLYRQKYK